MDLNDIENKVQKCYSLYVSESDPMFIFLYDKLEEAEDAYKALIDYFGESNLSLLVKYGIDFLDISIIDEVEGKIITVEKVLFYNTNDFSLIKPMSNKINGSFKSKRLKILTGIKVRNNGIRTSLQTALGEVHKIVTQLIPHE